MKYYIIAGEASGDVHGANLIQAIKTLDLTSHFRCWGGEKMQLASGDLVVHYKETSFMGFVEVVKHLPSIFRLFKKAKKDIEQYAPDVVILIDYPGFNLRLAQWLKRKGIKTIYYISPQVWAWKKNRVFKMDKLCDEIIVILPFEQKFFNNFGIQVHYVGHPLLDEIKTINTPDTQDPYIAILPGSREQEVINHLKIMVEGASTLKGFKIVISKMKSLDQSVYKNILSEITGSTDVILSESDPYHILKGASAAIVTSGTATLETAIIRVPQVVCYKGNRLSYWLARKLVKVPFISLVNLIVEKEIIPELIQEEFTPINVSRELNSILSRVASIKEEYNKLTAMLGQKGASQRAAAIIVNQ